MGFSTYSWSVSIRFLGFFVFRNMFVRLNSYNFKCFKYYCLISKCVVFVNFLFDNIYKELICLLVMRCYLIFVGVFLVSFPFVFGASYTNSTFDIAGCTFDLGGGVELGLNLNTCSSGEDIEGKYFCRNNSGVGDPLVTYMEPKSLGCARGEVGYEPNGSSCCPPGMQCVKYSDTEYICESRLTDCSNYTDCISECQPNDCICLNDGSCSDDVGELSCEYYNNEGQVACETDALEIAKNGEGSEFCGEAINCNGTSFLIECRCAWFTDLGGVCQIQKTGNQSIYYGAPPIDFYCTNEYNASECINGLRTLTWVSDSSPGAPSDCLNLIGCEQGSAVQQCGEAIIKLPGFSLFALIVSILLISMYYITRKSNQFSSKI